MCTSHLSDTSSSTTAATSAPSAWSRRAFLTSLAALAVPASAVATARSASAAPRRTTVVYAPHPDDETLRLSGLITTARQRGDRLVLVAVTDGGASFVGQARGMTPQQVMAMRIGEQTAAWAALAGPGAAVVRLGYADGAVRAGTITGLARTLDARYGPAVSHCAACHASDGNRDHAAIALGLAAAGLEDVHFSMAAPDIATAPGTLVPAADAGAAARADAAYAPFGHDSVPTEFAALRAAGYASRIAG